MNKPLNIVSVEPTPRIFAGWADLIRFRELLYFLVWRDLIVRYKQTAIGVAWLVLRPALFTAILYAVFNSIDRFRGEADVPYYIVLLCGIVPWFYFSAVVSESSGALISEAHLVSKIYFPRIFLPLVSVLANLLDLTILSVLVGLIAVFSGVTLTWHALAAVPLLLAGAVAAAGVGIGLSVLSARYRDFRYLTGFILQAGIFLTPVIYTSRTLIPPQLEPIYFLNPMAGVIEGVRWAVLGLPVSPTNIGISMASAAIVFLLALFLFRWLESDIADFV